MIGRRVVDVARAGIRRRRDSRCRGARESACRHRDGVPGRRARSRGSADRVAEDQLVEIVAPVDGVAEGHGVDRSLLPKPVGREPAPGERGSVQMRSGNSGGVGAIGCPGAQRTSRTTNVGDLGRPLALAEDRSFPSSHPMGTTSRSHRPSASPTDRTVDHHDMSRSAHAGTPSVGVLPSPSPAQRRMNVRRGLMPRLQQDTFTVFVSHESADK